MPVELTQIPSKEEIDAIVDRAFVRLVQQVIMDHFGIEKRWDYELKSSSGDNSGAVLLTRDVMRRSGIDLSDRLSGLLAIVREKADGLTLIEITGTRNDGKIPYELRRAVENFAYRAGEIDADSDLAEYLSKSQGTGT